LVGAADQRYEDTHDARQANEAAARNTAWAMAEADLGPDEARGLHGLGRALDDHAVAVLVWGEHPSGLPAAIGTGIDLPRSG
jgi:hypothetical protein